MELILVGLYEYENKVTAPNTSNITILARKVTRGCIAILDKACVVNYTTANKKLILGKRNSHSEDQYMVVRKNAQYYQAHMEGKIHLHEGDQALAVVEAPTASDECYATFFGKLYRIA